MKKLLVLLSVFFVGLAIAQDYQCKIYEAKIDATGNHSGLLTKKEIEVNGPTAYTANGTMVKIEYRRSDFDRVRLTVQSLLASIENEEPPRPGEVRDEVKVEMQRAFSLNKSSAEEISVGLEYSQDKFIQVTCIKED